MAGLLVILPLLVTTLVFRSGRSNPANYGPPPGIRCTFEEPCEWKWNDTIANGFRLVTGQELNATFQHRPGMFPGPITDADGNEMGHFLFLELSRITKEVHVWSPHFVSTREHCRFEVMIQMANLTSGSFKVVVETVNRTSWVIGEREGKERSGWEKYILNIGRISQKFIIVLEVVNWGVTPGHIAVDNIALVDCFPDFPMTNSCLTPKFQCKDELCIERWQVCDITRDCLTGEDEEQECKKVPTTGRCDFQEGWCGWHNILLDNLQWELHSGETPNDRTGPSFDHTYKNASGVYAYVLMAKKGRQMGDEAKLRSALFNPPPPCHSNISSPFYNSCSIRFHYHQYGPHSGSLALHQVEVSTKEKDKRVSQLFWSFGDKGDQWHRHMVVLPRTTHRYYLQFEARRGFSTKGDVAVDDISLSPECFGIGIPPEILNGYNYTLYEEPSIVRDPHKDFNKTYYMLSSCGMEGREGPTTENCSLAYNNTSTEVTMVDTPEGVRMQRWVVPDSGYYTIIAKGASGGKGANYEHGSSHGAVIRAIAELYKGQYILALVGQHGTDSCKKQMSSKEQSPCTPIRTVTPKETTSLIRELSKLEILDGGGGGGGATFVFLTNKQSNLMPLMIAAGGGGLGHNTLPENRVQHAHEPNPSLPPVSGVEHGNNSAGGGGGFHRNGNATVREISGKALMEGSHGGKACYFSTNGMGDGGFGGGGGGCNAGGGGGGSTGGSAWNDSISNGEGGYSFIGSMVLLGETLKRPHSGGGSIHIIPAVDNGCGCDFQCVALDEYRHDVKCLCPEGWSLDYDNTTCRSEPPSTHQDPKVPIWVYVIGAIASAVLFLFLAFIFFFLYNYYQHKKLAMMRRHVLSGPDLQLNRLREASDNMMTEYNPNYEFGGGTYTIRDLKDIPRDHLRLVKALGQGAFGEVYQGFFRHRAGDAVEMPVAVKTLPELSTSQAETDFLMEALIMSKFSHPNIVHFIGVCFDKHPRFIVLELLAGGDLKTFLRESRPKPERPSPLHMKDLLTCSMDVAKGCKYMEENRFIHRDIAARNCLLTTKGPGRVVKIADFGMARDIYRADYYRKGGKAMLPIKWMPPEAFMDGIFTSKTDVWSFGVLLWEVMSLGYMPYTGCANREVMQLVSSGGRLEPPNNCPGPLYGIMTQCWHPNPEERPNFSTLFERLGYCMQDPDVINAPLPVFHRPPSTERDMTIMRPPAHEESCLQVQRAADYLVPLSAPELPSSPSTSSVDKLLANSADWETSFVLPESRSTQPLLEQESSSSSEVVAMAAEKLPPAVGSLVSLEKTSPPAPTHTNNNNNNNNRGSLKGSLPLDASALTKQPLPYVNVNVTPSHVTLPQMENDMEVQNRPFTVQGAATRHLMSDTEISC